MPVWLRGAFALLAAICVGIVIGVAGDRAWIARSDPLTVHAMDTQALITRIDHEVSLDATQRAAITQILARHQATIDSAWRAMRPGVHAAIDSAQMEILAVLRPTQRERYLQWLGTVHRGLKTAATR